MPTNEQLDDKTISREQNENDPRAFEETFISEEQLKEQQFDALKDLAMGAKLIVGNLLLLKSYKSQFGKDAHYLREQKAAWDRAQRLMERIEDLF